jgi:hypothetical protein
MLAEAKPVTVLILQTIELIGKVHADVVSTSRWGVLPGVRRAITRMCPASLEPSNTRTCPKSTIECRYELSTFISSVKLFKCCAEPVYGYFRKYNLGRA